MSSRGLWGAAPFQLVALDLEVSACLNVHGLAADTRYCFRLERTRSCTSPTAAHQLEGAEQSDDEVSCFPSTATVDANSVDAHTGDRLGVDTADGASSTAQIGLNGSRGGGGNGCVDGGEASTFSEGCTTWFSDDSRRHGHASCTSSMLATAGRNHSLSGSEIHSPRTNMARGDEWEWPSMGVRHPQGGVSADGMGYDTPDTRFEAGRGDQLIVGVISIVTPPAVPFTLSVDACGPNLRLKNSNLTVVNAARKKWSALRATRGFTSGIHRWKVHLDR